MSALTSNGEKMETVPDFVVSAIVMLVIFLVVVVLVIFLFVVVVVVIVVAIDTDILELAQAFGDALVEVAVAGQVGLRLLAPGVHLDAESVVLELRQECTRVLEVLAPGKREEGACEMNGSWR